MIIVQPWKFTLTDLSGPERWRVDWTDERGEVHRQSFGSLHEAVDFSTGVLAARRLHTVAQKLRAGGAQ